MTTCRTRLRGDNNDTYNDIVVQVDKNGSYYTSTTYPDILKSVNNWQIRGVDLSNFHQRIRKGELLPATNFGRYAIEGEVTKHVYDTTKVSGSDTYHSYKTSGTGCPPPLWCPEAGEIQGAYSNHFTEKYVTEAAARIYSQGHDTLTFLAELTEVRKMFLKTGFRLLNLLKEVKSFSSLAKNSSKWLEYRYGWRVLVYDLTDLNAAVRKLNSDVQRTRYSQSSGDSYTSSRSDSTLTQVDTGMVLHTAWVEDVEISVRGSVVADVQPPTFQFNPLQTGWELIPFSFVVDWFVSVGKSIAALSLVSCGGPYAAAAGIQVKGKRTYSEYYELSSPYSGTYELEAESDFTWQVRHPCNIPLLPRFTVRLDGLKILDLLALIIQRK